MDSELNEKIISFKDLVYQILSFLRIKISQLPAIVQSKRRYEKNLKAIAIVSTAYNGN
jgi:hypothetical protein